MAFDLKVSQFAHIGIIYCQKTDTVKAVSYLMAQKNIGSIFVKEEGEIVGVWTQSDLKDLVVESRDFDEILMGEVMHFPVISIAEDEHISLASYLFKEHKLHHLLVTAVDGSPIGILSETDLIASKISQVLFDKTYVHELMNTHLNTLDESLPLSEVLIALKMEETDAAVVTRQRAGQEELGIISDRDILKYIGKGGDLDHLVGDIASWPLLKIPQEASLTKAREVMLAHHFHHIGVEDEQGECIGVLNFGHLMQATEGFFFQKIEQDLKDKMSSLDQLLRLYQLIVENTTSFILIHRHGKVLYSNPAALKAFGYTLEEMQNIQIIELVAPEFRPIVQERIAQAEHSGISQPRLDELMVTQQGERFWIEVSNSPIQFEGKDAVLAIAHNITHLKQEIEQQKIIKTVYEQMEEAILVTDEQTKVVSTNKAFTKLTGYQEDEIVGHPAKFLNSGYQPDAFYQKLWTDLSQKGHWEGEIWNKIRNGEVHPQWLSISKVLNEQGNIQNYVGIYQDLTHKKQVEAQIEQLSFYDEVTQLPNLTLFKNRANEMIKHRPQSEFAVIYCDVARFKRLNDTLGHDSGNKILYQVGKRIAAQLSEQDTVARMSSDAFLILLEPLNTNQNIEFVAQTFCQSLIANFEKPFKIEGQQHIIDIRLGVALYPHNEKNIEDLIVSADEALHAAKEMPGSYCQFYTKSLASTSFEHFFLEKGLRTALKNDHIVVFYQPQIDLQTQQVIGAEALVRWQHPELGLIPPDKFISLAEETGLIMALGEQVLEKACKQWLAWQARGVKLPRVSVNVSPIQLLEENFVEKICGIVHGLDMPINALEIEITESFLFKNEQQGLKAINELVVQGCRISMDDFGTGFSSLSLLKKMPLSQIKIDQSFVRHLPGDKGDMAIVKSVIEIAKAMEIEVIAEGIETEEHAQVLTQNHCQQGQGYLYSRPLPADEFEQWLINWEQQHA